MHDHAEMLRSLQMGDPEAYEQMRARKAALRASMHAQFVRDSMPPLNRLERRKRYKRRARASR